MITAYPKIFSIGTDYISDIFKDVVEITEKVDGSQFVFGKINGELQIRSKGAIIHREDPNKMFAEGVEYVCSIEDQLPDNTVFYTEYLRVPKHNTLVYDRVPKNHICLYGVSTPERSFTKDRFELDQWAWRLDIDAVPLLYHGMVEKVQDIHELLDQKSYLGGEMNREGIVVKNYQRPFLLGGQPIPLMAGKYVSEAFKEVHRANWSKENTGQGKWQLFKQGFRTEARWDKAIQHMRDDGLLANEPKDIGALIKAVKHDIILEEKEEILKFLWREFSDEVLRESVKGLPEYYKEHLLSRAFVGEGC
jgi:hypothetical protein